MRTTEQAPRPVREPGRVLDHACVVARKLHERCAQQIGESLCTPVGVEAAALLASRDDDPVGDRLELVEVEMESTDSGHVAADEQRDVGHTRLTAPPVVSVATACDAD